MQAGSDWGEAELEQALARGAAASVAFDETLAELRSSVTRIDAIEVLARAAMSMYFRIAGLERDPQAKGMEVFHLEILQALALSAPRCLDGERGEFARATSESIDLIERNQHAYRQLWLRKLTRDAKANYQLELIAFLQTWTMAIRGPRHPHQTEEFVRALGDGVEASFRALLGFAPEALISALIGVSRRIEERLGQHVEWMRGWARKTTGIAMIEAFAATMDADGAAQIKADALPRRYDRKAVMAYLMHVAEQRYVPLMTFERAELTEGMEPQVADKIMAVIDSLAFGFGDIGDATLAHLHLDNPVRFKPFIRLGDGRYLCCNPHSLGTHLAEIFQEICDRVPATKKRLEKVRATWLEEKLRALVATWLPHGDVYRSVKWSDPVTREDGESDVVVVIDKTMIVFEAKSGRIDGPARRGAVNSLKGALKTLVVEPSSQSLRFAEFLQRNGTPLTLKSDDGPLAIDAAQIRDIVRINVLVDVVGPLSAHWPQLEEAGLVPTAAGLAPTMSVFELETVLEVLTLEVERCHYLSRRADLERDMRYTADELDLLGFYLETQFNVGEAELKNEDVWLYGKSFEIAAAYGLHRRDGPPRFPIKRTGLWADILARLEADRPAGWTRFGHRLLNVGHDGQKEFGRLLRHGQKAVARVDDHFFTSAVTVAVGRQKQTVAFVVGPQPIDQAQFQENVQHAIVSAAEQSGVRDPLLIYWYQPPTGNAYDFIGTFKHARF